MIIPDTGLKSNVDIKSGPRMGQGKAISHTEMFNNTTKKLGQEFFFDETLAHHELIILLVAHYPLTDID
jgi:hypothetical protein